jgi:cyanophycinase-like exopeptidase
MNSQYDQGMKQKIFTSPIIHALAVCCLSALASPAFAQSYTSYFTGDSADVSPPTSFGICLMGGGTEHDDAMRWLLNRSGGGDIVVIRATGSNGYNSYLYSGLGVNVNSVETIVIPSLAAANDPYVEQQLANAEAVWIAGGDQYNYVSFWKGTKVDSLLNLHINTKQAPIGGTSAGMAILGGHYFSAANGTVTSATALSNPYNANVTVGHDDFINAPFLQDVITDTHYDNPDRKGRHVAFMARITKDLSVRSFGIACDEYTAVCIDSAGIARVFGEYPAYDDNAYFIQSSCLPAYLMPETCAAGSPLTWDQGYAALKVYAVKGDLNGTGQFDLNDWMTGSGGTWERWYVVSGQLSTASGTQPQCFQSVDEHVADDAYIYPNPAGGFVMLQAPAGKEYDVKIYGIGGSLVLEKKGARASDNLDISFLPNGMYVVETGTAGGAVFTKLIISK